MVIKRYPIFLLFLMLIVFVSAEDSIGQRQDAQIGTPYIISQPCATCTYINITILTKNGVVLENAPMTNNGTTWIYNFTANDSLRYDVNGKGDKDGSPDTFAFWFDATLSGEQNNATIIISDIILLLAIMGILLFATSKHQKVNFEDWNKKITDEHKNMGQTFVKAFVYNLFKNSFIWVYFIGWLFVLVLQDITYRFNSPEVYSYFTLIANTYSIGLILVGIFMLGTFASYMKNTIETLSDNNWGLNE